LRARGRFGRGLNSHLCRVKKPKNRFLRLWRKADAYYLVLSFGTRIPSCQASAGGAPIGAFTRVEASVGSNDQHAHPMKNIFMLYMPPGNMEAMVHYEDTIRKKVEPERIYAHVESSVRRKLEQTFDDRRIAVWGSRNSRPNRAKFDRMQEGDEVLIVEGDTIKLQGLVAAKTVNPALSHELWKNIDSEMTDGWDLVYFIANPREIGLPFTNLCRLLGYEETLRLRGFTAVAAERLEEFYSKYDDLYSILIAIKEGRAVVPVVDKEMIKPAEQSDKAEGSAGGDAGVDDKDDPSDHIKMQWTLLRMGKQAGEKVWAPRNDQSRITAAYRFTEFESTFAAGLDTQVRYVENIDVVWKAEYRIDAAFEIENSTSIYSGLLRFADLTMVAPNSSYPLFIVAPSERKSRVRDQLARPTFKHLRLSEKVRFLSYEKVREIDGFFGDSGQGLSAELINGKAERITV